MKKRKGESRKCDERPDPRDHVGRKCTPKPVFVCGLFRIICTERNLGSFPTHLLLLPQLHWLKGLVLVSWYCGMCIYTPDIRSLVSCISYLVDWVYWGYIERCFFLSSVVRELFY